MKDAQHLVIYATMPTMETAKTIVRTLVEERLLACANIVPGVYSLYWWDNAVQTEQEVAVIGKTVASRYPLLESRFKELHPYEVPCLVALPIENGFPPYLQWIEQETHNPANS